MKKIAMNKIKYTVILFSTVCLMACTEEHMGPLPNSGARVAPVTNVQVENIAGGAVVSYDLPKDKNARYVEAQWTNAQGVLRQAKSSVYTTQIRLEGFPDTQEYEVMLYTVSDAELRSDPVAVSINPLTPPVTETANSLIIQEDFGGMNVTFENVAEEDLVITVLVRDEETGQWEPWNDFYTSLPSGNYSVRGLPAVEGRFGLFVRDRWENYSDTSYVTLTPLHEELLDKSMFKEFVLPGDVGNNYLNGNTTMSRLFDGNIETYMHTDTYNSAIMPGVSFAFDTGVSAKISRFTLWQRFRDSPGSRYLHANFREFEIWGTNDLPDLNGSWDNWIKLMDCEVIKPSGLPPGEFSNEDLEALEIGHEFILPLDSPPVRFIRIKVNTVWGNVLFIQAAELSFWGEIKE